MPEGVDDDERRGNRAAIRGPREIAPATSWGGFCVGVSWPARENAARGGSAPRMGGTLTSHLRNWRNYLVCGRKYGLRSRLL